MPAGSASNARAAAALRPSTSMMSSDGAPRAKEISCSAVMPHSLRAAPIDYFGASGGPLHGMSIVDQGEARWRAPSDRSHFMIGLVLAAGAGRRLRPYTDALPKALLPVDGDM